MGGMLKVGRALFFLGLVLAIVGFFRPWIPHASVALVVTGFELDEFAWLFPQVQSGAVALTRGLFLLPVTAAAVLLGLGIARLPVRWWVRLIPLGFAVTLALVPLPPYEVLQDDPGDHWPIAGASHSTCPPLPAWALDLPCCSGGRGRDRAGGDPVRSSAPGRCRLVRHVLRPRVGIDRLRGWVRASFGCQLAVEPRPHHQMRSRAGMRSTGSS